MDDALQELPQEIGQSLAQILIPPSCHIILTRVFRDFYQKTAALAHFGNNGPFFTKSCIVKVKLCPIFPVQIFVGAFLPCAAMGLMDQLSAGIMKSPIPI